MVRLRPPALGTHEAASSSAESGFKFAPFRGQTNQQTLPQPIGAKPTSPWLSHARLLEAPLGTKTNLRQRRRSHPHSASVSGSAILKSFLQTPQSHYSDLESKEREYPCLAPATVESTPALHSNNYLPPVSTGTEYEATTVWVLAQRTVSHTSLQRSSPSNQST